MISFALDSVCLRASNCLYFFAIRKQNLDDIARRSFYLARVLADKAAIAVHKASGLKGLPNFTARVKIRFISKGMISLKIVVAKRSGTS